MSFFKIIIAFCLCLITVTVQAYEDFTLDPSTITRVYDGDTFYVTIPYLPDLFGKNLGIRLAGIDTPELRSGCKDPVAKEAEISKAKAARTELRKHLTSAHAITLVNPKRDKYFRVVATVLVDNVDVGQLLIQNQLARPYDGGTKKSWCG